MYKAITFLVILGYTFGAPAPRVEDQLALIRSDNDFNFSGNVLRRMESSLDGIEPIFTRHNSGGEKRRAGFLPAIDVELNDNRVLPENRLPKEDFRGQPRDPYVGTEEAAARAVNSPLFFDTFDHAHMVTSYSERRQSPLLFRSIRPDFPFSDVSIRRQGN